MSGAGSAATAGSPGWRVRAYGELIRVGLRSKLIYRASFVVSLVVLFVQIFALRTVWTWVYAGRESVQGTGGSGAIGLSTQLAYVSLATIQFWVFNQWSTYSLPNRIREGKVGTDLIRPVGLIPQALLGKFGVLAAGLPFAIAAVPVAFLVGGAAAPVSGWALLAYVGTALGGMVVSSQLALLLDLIAFWTLEVSGFYLSYSLVNRFLSGALVPLWFMPEWLRAVSGVLPFQTTTYAPVAIYLGTIRGTDVWAAIGVQLVWIGLLWMALRLVGSRAVRRVVVQGG